MTAYVTPTGFMVMASRCLEDPALSHVRIAVDLPGAPEGLALSIDRETALQMADDLRRAVATLESGERGRLDA